MYWCVGGEISTSDGLGSVYRSLNLFHSWIFELLNQAMIQPANKLITVHL